MVLKTRHGVVVLPRCRAICGSGDRCTVDALVDGLCLRHFTKRFSSRDGPRHYDGDSR